MEGKSSHNSTIREDRVEFEGWRAVAPTQLVTTVTTLIAKAGQEGTIAREFTRAFAAGGGEPHHLATLLIQQEDGLSFLVSHFRDHGELAAWRASLERQRLISTFDSHSLRDLCTIVQPVAHIVVPSGGSGPKWKTLISTWIVTYPLLLAVIAMLGVLAPDLPVAVALGLVSATMSVTALWIISPVAGRLTRTWRLKGQQMRVEVLEYGSSA